MAGVPNDVYPQPHLDWHGARAEAFHEMQKICASNQPLPEIMRACAHCLDQEVARTAPPRLAEQARASASALLSAAAGDYSRVAAQFTDTVAATPTRGDEERIFALLIKDIDERKGPYPLVAHARLDVRARAAQLVLRDRGFVQAIARRLGVEGFPEAVLQSRVQGVQVLASAGHLRYAIFGDFVHGLNSSTTETDGGLLLSVLASDFLNRDLPVVDRVFPTLKPRLEALGALDLEALNFLFTIFLVLHDTLGHTVPYSVHHRVKGQAGCHLVDPIEEFGADSQFLWIATSKVTQPFLRSVLTAAEYEALPLAWLIKRICHYPLRAAGPNCAPDAIVMDPDARMAICLWNFCSAHGLIEREGAAFHIREDRFAPVFEVLLDEWLAVEQTIARGAEAYAGALSSFYARFGSIDPTGRWTLPGELAALVSGPALAS